MIRRSLHGAQLPRFVIACSLMMLVTSAVAAQQGPVSASHHGVLEEITVTASRTGAAIRDVATSISIVPEAELQQQFSLGSNVLQVLDITVPGLNVATRDTRQAGCASTLRGRVPSFQINGIPVNQDLRRSNCNGMFQVSPFALERVEVVRGSTALYGSGAPGGIVNLITRRASSKELEVDTVVQFGVNPHEADRSDEYTVYAGVGQIVGNWDYYGGVSYQESNAGRTPDGDFVFLTERDNYSVTGSVGYEMAGVGRFRVTGTFFEEDLGDQWAPDGDQFAGMGTVVRIADHPDREDAKDRLYTVGISLERDDVLGHRLLLSGYVQDQRYRQRDNFFDKNFDPADFFFASDTDNERQGFRSTLARTFSLDQVNIEAEYGFDYVHQRFYRPIIDTEADDAIIGFVAPDTKLDTYSLFIQSSVDFSRWRVNGGIRREMYRGEIGRQGFDPAISDAAAPGDMGDDSVWLGNAGVVFDLNDRFQVYAGFSQGAELTELSRAARGVTDPRLISTEAATSDQWEVGLRGSYGPVYSTAAAFYSESDRSAQLQADPSCAGEPICPLIPLRVEQKIHGVEATLDWTVTARLAAGLLFTWQDGEIFDQELDRFVDFGTDIISPLRTTGYIEFEPWDGWHNRLQMTYSGEIDQFTPAEQGIGRINTDSTFVADFTSSYAIGPGEVTLSVSNLFNEEYINVTNQGRSFGFFSVTEEGTRVTVGYRARF